MGRSWLVSIDQPWRVWHVTKDGVFLGDYIAEDPALNAANGAADVVEKRGGAAEIVITRQ